MGTTGKVSGLRTSTVIMPGKFFLIKSLMNGKCLDITESSSDPETPVVMYEPHGGDNQQWYVDHRKGVIRSKLNDMVLEISHDNRLVINDFVEGAFNQQFKLGEDRIQHGHFRHRVFDVVGASDDDGAEVCTWEWHGGDNQRWEFEYMTGIYFMIMSDMNGKVLDQKKCEEGEKVCMWEPHGGDNQLWYEDPFGVLRTKTDDLALDFFKTVGKSVRLATFKVGLTQQMWTLEDNKIMNLAKPDICLDIKGSSNSNGAKIVCWPYEGHDNQHWHAEYVDQ